MFLYVWQNQAKCLKYVGTVSLLKYCVSAYPKSPNFSKVVLSLRLWSLYDYCVTVITSIIVGTRRGAKRVMDNKNRFFIFQNSLKYPSWTRLIHFNTIKDCFYSSLLVTLNKEWSFPLGISSVKVTKSAVSNLQLQLAQRLDINQDKPQLDIPQFCFHFQ